jgi:hypothetical protein
MKHQKTDKGFTIVELLIGNKELTINAGAFVAAGAQMANSFEAPRSEIKVPASKELNELT